MMNETGNYPGQAWLWLYTFWYQIKPFSTSTQRRRADLGDHGRALPRARLRAVPPGRAVAAERLGVYRLIWRDYYRQAEARRE